MRKIILISAGAFVLYALLTGYLGSILGLQAVNLWVFRITLWVLGLAAAGAAIWYLVKNMEQEETPAQGEASGDFSVLIREAQAKLSAARKVKGGKLSSLPLVFVVGDSNSAKTTTIVNSGIEAELLAGEVFRDAKPIATPVANIWYAKGAVLVEAAGKFLADDETWKGLVGRLQPAALGSAFARGAQPQRLALVCIDVERFLVPGAGENMQALARTLRNRLGEIAGSLGASIPVYALFTKLDRIPFFTEFVRNITPNEADQIFGAALPGSPATEGIYGEQQSARISTLYDELTQSLCSLRPEYLSRENEPNLLPAIYEFPREFRKLRPMIVQFLVELCRPSQLAVGPNLQGFYFSGVRPVVVTDAPTPVQRMPEPREPSRSLEATGIFKGGREELLREVASEARGSSRKVPQWMFLTRMFSKVIFPQSLSQATGGISTKTTLMRRLLLTGAAFAGLFYCIASTVSYSNNKAIVNQIRESASGLTEVPKPIVATPTALKKLEASRETVETLNGFQKDGAPWWTYRWGLYSGQSVYPEARRLYFESFRKLLLAQTQARMVEKLTQLPAAPPGPEYKPSYDTLKAYLMTTSNANKTMEEPGFLAPVLLERWREERNIDPGLGELAKNQFEFYSSELKAGNPFTEKRVEDAILNARRYLNQFGSEERIYQAMLAKAGKNKPSINFNKIYPGSASVVVASNEVAGAFSKAGWEAMNKLLADKGEYAGGAEWVLGEQTLSNKDQSGLAQKLTAKYAADFVKQWRNFLKGASVIRYKNLQDAADKLNTLSVGQSPLLALFALVSENTNVAAAEARQPFDSARKVIPPEKMNPLIGDTNRGYMTALTTLQVSIDAASKGDVGENGDPTSQANATAARIAARSLAQTFGNDTEQLEAKSEKLLLDPILNAEEFVRPRTKEALIAKGQQFCAEYRKVMSKLPFSVKGPGAASVEEINKLFRKPDGALWVFYESALQKYMTKNGATYMANSVAPVAVAPAFIGFFNKTAAMAESMYPAGSQDPKIYYMLKQIPTETAAVKLRLDGGGEGERFWEVSGAHEAQGTVKVASYGELPFVSEKGLWSVFQFIGSAEVWSPIGSTWQLEWPVDLTVSGRRTNVGRVRYTLDLGRNSSISPKGQSAAGGCMLPVAGK